MGVAFKDFTDIKATFLIHLIFNIKDALDILPSEFYGPLICGFQRVADGIYGYTNLFWLPHFWTFAERPIIPSPLIVRTKDSSCFLCCHSSVTLRLSTGNGLER